MHTSRVPAERQSRSFLFEWWESGHYPKKLNLIFVELMGLVSNTGMGFHCYFNKLPIMK